MPLRNTIIAMLCPLFNLYAQNNDNKPIAFGDPVPDIEFHTMINHSSPSAKLSDFKGKLIILDFWATWCTSCIHGFPKLNSLQNEFDDNLQIILINNIASRDDVKKVNLFFKNWQSRTGNRLNLPTSVLDTAAKKYFPHRLIPHYVWIDQEGKLIAYSSSEKVNALNIRSILEGKGVDFSMKIDQDVSKPLYANEFLPIDNLLNYTIFLKGQLEGIPGGERLRYSGEISHGIVFFNSSLVNMYKAISRKMRKDFFEKKFLLELLNKEKLLHPLDVQPGSDWYNSSLYSFDFILPVNKAPILFEEALSQLNSHTGYYGRFENRKIKCLVLKYRKNGNTLKTKNDARSNKLWQEDNPYLVNGSMELLVTRLNALDNIKIVIDETGLKDNIDIRFPDGFSDLASIQKQLSVYGLTLKEVYREVEVFVLSEK